MEQGQIVSKKREIHCHPSFPRQTLCWPSCSCFWVPGPVSFQEGFCPGRCWLPQLPSKSHTAPTHIHPITPNCPSQAITTKKNLKKWIKQRKRIFWKPQHLHKWKTVKSRARPSMLPYLCARICVAAGNCSSGMSCHISHTHTCHFLSSWSSSGTDRSQSPSCHPGRTCSLGFHRAILPGREPLVSISHSRHQSCPPASPGELKSCPGGPSLLRSMNNETTAGGKHGNNEEPSTSMPQTNFLSLSTLK